MRQLIEQIRHNPDSRRLIVSAWNPAEVNQMALPPCHCLFQFYVANGRLSCQLYQRSADIFLGVPFNIASYSLLTLMLAQVTNLQPGEFIHTFGDVHLYANHQEQAKLQLSREPRELPRMQISKLPAWTRAKLSMMAGRLSGWSLSNSKITMLFSIPAIPGIWIAWAMAEV